MSIDGSHNSTPHQAAEHLRAHPWIGEAQVEGDHIRLTPSATALAVQPCLGPLLAEHLDHWGEVYDWTYHTGSGWHADELDLSGWRASDTGAPLPVEHMTEWVRHTIDLICQENPQWILEIGCGTGLLTHRLSPHVRGYVGTDIAMSAVENLANAKLPNTKFVRAGAHETQHSPTLEALQWFPDGQPDCIVLNSVTQCFPNIAYLESVLHNALDLVSNSGTVVVGDVRHAGLLWDYSEWVERAHNEAGTGADIARRAEQDEELLFDPIVLARIAAGSKRSVRMATYPKTMRANTELTRYRFDAVLHVESESATECPDSVLWDDLPMMDRIQELTERVNPGVVCVYGIPNALLENHSANGVTPARLRQALLGKDAAVVMDPTNPRRLEVVRPAHLAPKPVDGITARGQAHEPVHDFVRRRLVEVARGHLRRTLPEQVFVPITVDPMVSF